MIEISICEHCGYHQLTINGTLVLKTSEEGIVKRVARILEHCRNIPYRAAIKLMIDDIGYSEDTSKHVYNELFEHRNTGAMN